MDYSQITNQLFIGTTPRAADYQTLRALGITCVINMRLERPPYRDPHSPPMHVLWLPTIDSPLFPIPMRALRKGAEIALAALSAGGKVYTHCAGGIHRGAAMGAAILIALGGHSPQEAMQLIMQRRPIADPHIWYIRRRILRFAKMWQRAGQ